MLLLILFYKILIKLGPEMCVLDAVAGADLAGDTAVGVDAGPAPCGHLAAFTVLFLLLSMSLRFISNLLRVVLWKGGLF